MSDKSKLNELNQKLAEVDKIVEQFENNEVELSDAVDKYKQAIESANEAKEYLQNLKNEIVVLSEDFSRSADGSD